MQSLPVSRAMSAVHSTSRGDNCPLQELQREFREAPAGRHSPAGCLPSMRQSTARQTSVGVLQVHLLPLLWVHGGCLASQQLVVCCCIYLM